MKNLILKFIFVILSFLMISGVKAQDCITFHSDYSGMEWDDTERQLITTAACDLKTLITDAGVSGFKVHTFGFYGYNPNMQGGTEAVWNEFLSTKVNTSTPHLAIGKEINLDGTFKKFWVSLNIPNQGMLDCYTESDKNNILSILASLNSGNSQSYPTPKSILEKTKSLVSIIICRCGEENGNRSGCTTPTLNSIEDELTLLGYANYNHLESISFQPKDYIGGLTSSYKILLKINSSVASAESFPNGTFELTEELNDFLGEAGGNAVVYYIDKNNIHLFKDILNGGPSFNKSGTRSGGSYLEKIFLLNLNGQVKVYYTIDAELPAENGARAGGIGTVGKKALIWFCKRSALNPSTFVLGIVLDYTAEALINYWFDNDAGNDFLLTFYNVVKSRGITGFAISVGQQVVNSPVGYFIGTFLNCIITGKDPLTAVATAALNTAFQAALKGVSKSSPLIKKYIKGLTDEALENPGLIVKIILESNTRTRWKLKTKWLNDIDGTSGTFKKGNWGEIVGDLHLIGRGYERISSRVVQTLDDPLEKGIDGVFKKGGKYFVVEYKYNKSTLNSKTIDGKQMSDDWVEGSDRLFNAIGDRVLANQLIKNKSYTKLLCNIKPDGSMIWQKLNATATGQGTIIQI